MTAIEGKPISLSFSMNNGVNGWTSLGDFTFSTVSREDFKPVRAIYNPPMTICYFRDGSKVTVKTMEGEEFSKEGGIMNCIVKKIFDSHNEFKRLVASGHDEQEAKRKKEEKKAKKTA